jgi:hypothetical protein
MAESEFKPIQVRCKDEFHRVFELNNHEPYLDWNGVQARHLYIFLNKIKNLLVAYNRPTELEDVFRAYSDILQLLPTDWLKSQSLSVLSGRLSQIIVEIKAHKKKKNGNPIIDKNINEINEYLNEKN